MPRSRQEIQLELARVRSKFEREFGLEVPFEKLAAEIVSALLAKRTNAWLTLQLDHLSSLDLFEVLSQAQNRVKEVAPKRVSDPGKPGRRRLYDEKK